MLDVGDDLASEYKADALRFKESKELRSLLVATVKECAGHTKGYREFLYQQLTPILRDFRLHGAGDGDTPNAKIGYMFTEINKGRIEWAMTIFLAWLCVYHEDAAAKFYARANLAEKGKPYRQYRGEAGQWAAARNAAKPPVGPDASANPDPGPILPDDIGQIGEGPAIVAQIPTRAPIRFPHPDGICNASFSPCGKLIVTAGKKAQSGDAGAFVWRIDVSAASQDKRKIASHSSDILFAGFSPEGRHVISTAANIAKVSYSTALVEPLFTLRHEKQIALCTYSDDGKRIATGSWDGTARVWDAQSGKLLKTIRPGVRRNHAVNSAYFSPNGAHLLLGSSDSSISIWHIGSATRVSNFVSDESDGVCSAIYSRDGKSNSNRRPRRRTGLYLGYLQPQDHPHFRPGRVPRGHDLVRRIQQRRDTGRHGIARSHRARLGRRETRRRGPPEAPVASLCSPFFAGRYPGSHRLRRWMRLSLEGRISGY
jgi:hypothetical protein